MHKYVAKQEVTGTLVLHKDGQPTICPKTIAVIPQPGAMGGVSMNATQFPCNTRCPFAEIKKMTPKKLGWSNADDETQIDIYEISCEGAKKHIALDEINLTKQKNGLLSV